MPTGSTVPMSSVDAVQGPPARGVYFLANDTIYELAVAFLNSLRASNPRIPLCLIPYDGHCERLINLSGSHQFSVFSDADVLDRCDRISVALHGRVVGEHRKLAAWEGKFEEFIYIDSDTVVLRDLSSIFNELREFDILTSHSNQPSNRKWVWRDSILETDYLTADQIAYSAAAGLIISRKGALSLQQAEARLDSAVRLAPHMELRCTDQPLMNYLIVTSGMRYSSLSAMSEQQGRHDMPLEFWAGSKGGKIRGGEIRFPGDHPVLLVHWAGQWRASRSRHRFYNLLRRLSGGRPSSMRPFLKYGRLWRHYRHLTMPAQS